MGQRHVINITDVSGDVLLCSGSSKWVPRDDLAVTDHPYLHAIQQSAIQHAIQVKPLIQHSRPVTRVLYSYTAYTALYSAIQYTVIQRYTVYSLYNTPQSLTTLLKTRRRFHVRTVKVRQSRSQKAVLKTLHLKQQAYSH